MQYDAMDIAVFRVLGPFRQTQIPNVPAYVDKPKDKKERQLAARA